MLAKILGAVVGEKLANDQSKTKGALIGAATAAVARRGLGPLGLVLAAGYGLKKFRDYRRSQRAAA